jgi:hypothetical protein
MKFEGLTAVTTKNVIFNTTTPCIPVRTNIAQELPASTAGSLAWKDDDQAAFPILPFPVSL